jgi:hypothetical protein
VIFLGWRKFNKSWEVKNLNFKSKFFQRIWLIICVVLKILQFNLYGWKISIWGKFLFEIWSRVLNKNVFEFIVEYLKCNYVQNLSKLSLCGEKLIEFANFDLGSSVCNFDWFFKKIVSLLTSWYFFLIFRNHFKPHKLQFTHYQKLILIVCYFLRNIKGRRFSRVKVKGDRSRGLTLSAIFF